MNQPLWSPSGTHDPTAMTAVEVVALPFRRLKVKTILMREQPL
ncbi:hypothetical protein [Methylosinus sp. Sm6]|nr:hypothetical protein [Methylosinus sp. Sm6]